jgi:hypothetical protein
MFSNLQATIRDRYNSIKFRAGYAKMARAVLKAVYGLLTVTWNSILGYRVTGARLSTSKTPLKRPLFTTADLKAVDNSSRRNATCATIFAATPTRDRSTAPCARSHSRYLAT